MKKWNNNNRSCVTLWTTLRIMNQLDSSFDASGTLKMSNLLYYNPLSSSDERKMAAALIAYQLDAVFVAGRGAVYEQGVDGSTAIAGMLEILVKGDKLVEDLAETADELYAFWNEDKQV